MVRIHGTSTLFFSPYPMNERSRWILLPLILSLGVWSASISNGFVWDDHILIEKNATNLSSFSLRSIFGQDFWTTETDAGSSNYYRPLVTLSYVIDYAIFGASASGYHITNVVLHTVNVRSEEHTSELQSH